MITDFEKIGNGEYRRYCGKITEVIDIMPDGHYVITCKVFDKEFVATGRGREPQAMQALQLLRMEIRMYYAEAALHLREAKGQRLPDARFRASYALATDSELQAKVRNDFYKA